MENEASVRERGAEEDEGRQPPPPSNLTDVNHLPKIIRACRIHAFYVRQNKVCGSDPAAERRPAPLDHLQSAATASGDFRAALSGWLAASK